MAGRDSDRVSVTTRTGDFTLSSADAGDIVEVNKATAVTVTVPPFLSVPFPVGTRVDLLGVPAEPPATVSVTDDPATAADDPEAVEAPVKAKRARKA